MSIFRVIYLPCSAFITLRWFCCTYPHFSVTSPQGRKQLNLPAKCFTRKLIYASSDLWNCQQKLTGDMQWLKWKFEPGEKRKWKVWTGGAEGGPLANTQKKSWEIIASFLLSKQRNRILIQKWGNLTIVSNSNVSKYCRSLWRSPSATIYWAHGACTEN